MAKTVHNGTYVATGTTNLINGSGAILGLLVSHAEATIQTITLYDALAASPGDEIAVLNIAPESQPFYLMLARTKVLTFSTGLTIVTTNCHTNVWAVAY